jgi:hypothetical protein
LADAAPGPAVTLEGTLRLALLLDKATANPPVGAAEVSETVQDKVPGVWMVPAPQLTPLRDGGIALTEIVPGLAVVGIDAPAVEEATGLASETVMLPAAPPASWKVAVATTPLAIVLVFSPYRIQVTPEQVSCLLAAVAAGPATTATPVIPAGKLKLH